jgi:hypothetical protein
MATRTVDKLDKATDIFLQSIAETAAQYKIELMEDATSNAKSLFFISCIGFGIPNKATAKESGKQFVLKLIELA